MAEGGDFSQNTVFIRNKDLPSNRDANVNDYDLFEAINDTLDTKNGVLCIQRDGEIWQVDLKSAEDCKKLKEKGIKVNEPFPNGVKIPTVQGKEQILICGLPNSIDKNYIKDMLTQMGVILLTDDTDVMTEVICDPDTKKNTLVPNGNRSMSISSLEEDKCLPRNVKCADVTCRLYHSGQETRTFKVKCYDKVCRVCLEPDHDPTSPECWYNTSQSEDVVTLSKATNKVTKTFPCAILSRTRFKEKIVVLNEDSNPLSMSYRCQFSFEGKQYNSAIEAYQTKRIGPSSVETSNIFQDNNLEVKGWTERKDVVMKNILKAKFHQVMEIHERLKSIGIRTAEFAEATADDYWGTGLSRQETEQTHPSQWPGENRLGTMIKEIVSEMINIPKITFYNLNANGLRDENKRNHLFTWLQREAFDIVFLQETGFDVGMDFNVRYSHFDFHHCFAVQNKKWNGGVSILVKKSPDFPFEVKDETMNTEGGRMLSLHIRYKEKSFVLINIYANSGTSAVRKRKTLFTEVFNLIKEKYRDADNIILGGDFNCKLDSTENDTSRDFLERELRLAKLFDSWKEFRRNEKGFTRNQHRIDYIFLHDNLKSSFINMCILTPPSLQDGNFISDHDGIYFELGTSRTVGFKNISP